MSHPYCHDAQILIDFEYSPPDESCEPHFEYFLSGQHEHEQQQLVGSSDLHHSMVGDQPVDAPSSKKRRRKVTQGSNVALMEKGTGSADVMHQVGSIIQFLKKQAQDKIIEIHFDARAPYSMAGFIVRDIEEFQRQRKLWFEKRSLRTCVDGQEYDKSKGVIQAFRRIGMIPVERKGRTYDWENGSVWTFDPRTFQMYGTPSRIKNPDPADQLALTTVASAPDSEPRRTLVHTLLDIMDTLKCPLSQEVLRDPVLVPESGISYERASIERWFLNHSTDPVTQQALVSKLLIPNHALKHSIAGVRDMAFPAGMGRRAAAGSGRDKLARHATAPSPDSSQEEDKDR